VEPAPLQIEYRLCGVRGELFELFKDVERNMPAIIFEIFSLFMGKRIEQESCLRFSLCFY